MILVMCKPAQRRHQDPMVICPEIGTDSGGSEIGITYNMEQLNEAKMKVNECGSSCIAHVGWLQFLLVQCKNKNELLENLGCIPYNGKRVKEF